MSAVTDDRARRHAAKARFRRSMIYILVAAVLMEIATMIYLSAFGALTTTTAIAASLGVILSVIVGAGLMALGFLSSNSGHDDRASGRGEG